MSWQREALRDLEALGSLMFYIVVASRSLIGKHWYFLVHAAAALALSLLLWQLVKALLRIRPSSHAANATMLLILVNAFYQDWLFGVFTVLVFGLVLHAHARLRKHKKHELLAGAAIGLLAIGAAGLLTQLLL